MNSQSFTVGQKFRVLNNKGCDPKEIRTVEKVCSDFIIYSSNSKRWAGCNGISTDTALGAMEIEMLPDALTHYTNLLNEARAAA